MQLWEECLESSMFCLLKQMSRMTWYLKWMKSTITLRTQMTIVIRASGTVNRWVKVSLILLKFEQISNVSLSFCCIQLFLMLVLLRMIPSAAFMECLCLECERASWYSCPNEPLVTRDMQVWRILFYTRKMLRWSLVTRTTLVRHCDLLFKQENVTCHFSRYCFMEGETIQYM